MKLSLERLEACLEKYDKTISGVGSCFGLVLTLAGIYVSVNQFIQDSRVQTDRALRAIADLARSDIDRSITLLHSLATMTTELEGPMYVNDKDENQLRIPRFSDGVPKDWQLRFAEPNNAKVSLLVTLASRVVNPSSWTDGEKSLDASVLAQREAFLRTDVIEPILSATRDPNPTIAGGALLVLSEVRKLLQSKSTESFEIRGAVFGDVNLSPVKGSDGNSVLNFSGFRFVGCSFENARSIKDGAAFPSGTRFIGASFDKTAFANRVFEEIDFSNCVFDESCFRNCTFDKRCRFDGMTIGTRQVGPLFINCSFPDNTLPDSIAKSGATMQ